MLGILPLLLVCNTVWSDTTTPIWFVERLTGNEYLELHGGDYSIENDKTEVATQGFPGGQVEPDSIVGNPPPTTYVRKSIHGVFQPTGTHAVDITYPFPELGIATVEYTIDCTHRRMRSPTNHNERATHMTS